MNPKDQLAEIEKEIDASFEDEEYNVNCGTKRGFLLGTISQLKIRLEELEPYVDFMDVSNEDNTKTSEIKLKLIKEGYDKIDKISADLKFYEDKLKEMGE